MDSVSETIPTPLSINELANWLSNPEVKNNPDIGKKPIPKSDNEWYELMDNSEASIKTYKKDNQNTNLRVGKAKSKKFISEEYIEGGFPTKYPIPSGDIIFEEAEVGDPDRPHLSLSSLSKWQAIVLSSENPAYSFNTPINDHKKYVEAPYISHLMASAREQITSVLKTEF